MAPWEQVLKQRLSEFLLSEDGPQRQLWGTFWPTSGSDSDTQKASVQHRLPKCFSDRSWDLGRESAGSASAQTEASRSNVRPPLQTGPVELPSFFMNKDWDLGKTANVRCMAPDLPKQSDESGIIYPRQRTCSFCLQPSDRFGMVLEETPEPLPGGLLVVASVDARSAFARTVGGGRGLMSGDVILEVNGNIGAAAPLRELLLQQFSAPGQRTVDVVVRSRPTSFNIELWREGVQWQKLGLAAIADAANPECLVVEGIRAEGLVPLWNVAHGSLRICKGDLITHVNGISDVAAMKTEIKESSTKGSKLRFRIVTPAGKAAGCHKTCSKEQLEGMEDSSLGPETTVPWDMQVRWLDDNMSEVSTSCGSSNPSGMRTPEESSSCPSGARTPERDDIAY